MNHAESKNDAPVANEPSAARYHIPALDGLRGIAILLVMWRHFTPDWLPNAVGGWAGLAHNLANAGWAGVDLFFVLSGFLITGILWDAKPPAGSGGRAACRYFAHFYARRTLRIFPLYYAVLSAVTIGVLGFAGSELADRWRDQSAWLWFYASNIITARQGWSFRFGGVVLNHFWSLAIEEQFYLAWPMVVYFCGRRSLRDGCIAALLLTPLLRYYWTGIDGNGYASFALMPCRIDSFAAGALVALAARGLLSRHDHSKATFDRNLVRAGAILTLVGVLLIIPTFWTSLMIDVVGRSALAILASGLILLAIYSPAGRSLDLPPLRFLGKYSYGIYVLHFLFYHPLDYLFPLETVGIMPRFIGCALASTAMAWCSWHLLEKHFLKLKRRFPMSPPSPQAAPFAPPAHVDVPSRAAPAV